MKARVLIARSCITTTTNAASSATRDRTRRRRQDDRSLLAHDCRRKQSMKKLIEVAQEAGKPCRHWALQHCRCRPVERYHPCSALIERAGQTWPRGVDEYLLLLPQQGRSW